MGNADAHPGGNFLRQRTYPQHVLGHIVMHLARFLDIEMQRGHLELLLAQDRLGFPQGPGKVVAIVIEIDVGVLRGVEAAVLAIAEPLIHPADNVAGHMRVELITEDLVRVDVILQQLGIVVRHLLEVRHDPALVHRVAMKASRELIVNSALRHLRQRGGDDGGDAFLARAHVPIHQQIEGGGMRKFRGAAEAAVLLVEDGQRRLHHDAHNAWRKLDLPLGITLCSGQHGHGFAGRLQHLIAPFAISVGNRQQGLLETGTAPTVIGREIRAAVKGMAVGREKNRQRPAARAGDGRHRELITAVHIGPLVAIDLDRDKVLVDDLGGVGVFVGFAVHDVAPMTPHRANVEQDGLVLALRRGERLFAPLVPLDGLMHRRAQVSGRRLRQ